ncbi:MAG TPA: glycosyltransferase family A protein [bacterium]|nr:glycosyltransferase family A protein [bacterium]
MVIPAAAAPDVFAESISSIFQNSLPPREVIVVDDAMDDNARRTVERFAVDYPIRIITHRGHGVSAARNAGARSASGSIILFMDTDVVLKPNALQVVCDALADDEIDGVVGVQSARLRFGDFFSRWKNLWMRYTYQRLTGNIHLFYTSCAAIRTQAFTESGGFDEAYRLPSIEDTVFGAALGRQGKVIRPEPRFEVEHVKSYGLWSVLKTDRKRSAALVKYTLRNIRGGHSAGTGQTSVPAGFILGSGAVLLAWLLLLAFALGCGWNCLGGAAAMILLLWIFNAGWLAYLLQEEGFEFFTLAMLFLPLDVTWVNLGIFQGGISFCIGKKY